MPFDYRWLVPGRVLYMDAYDNVTLDEFLQITTLELPDYDPRTILHTIVHTERITSVPPLAALARMDSVDKRGWIIFVSGNDDRVGAFLATIMMKALGMNFRQTKTIDEGIAVLRRAEPSLADVAFPEDVTTQPLLGQLLDSRQQQGVE